MGDELLRPAAIKTPRIINDNEVQESDETDYDVHIQEPENGEEEKEVTGEKDIYGA